jgi:dUTP pyrophosphatase
MKIKIKLYDKGCMPLITAKGDWIDCFTAHEVTINGPIANTLNGKRNHRNVEFVNELIPLGFAMQLPKGFEAVALPRSSTYGKNGVILGNMQGVLDNTYNSDKDQWWFNAVAFRDTVIPKYTKICQFRIQLSQFANFWQKLKWLFWNGKIKFVEVDYLGNETRGSSMTNNTTNK